MSQKNKIYMVECNDRYLSSSLYPVRTPCPTVTSHVNLNADFCSFLPHCSLDHSCFFFFSFCVQNWPLFGSAGKPMFCKFALLKTFLHFTEVTSLDKQLKNAKNTFTAVYNETFGAFWDHRNSRREEFFKIQSEQQNSAHLDTCELTPELD